MPIPGFSARCNECLKRQVGSLMLKNIILWQPYRPKIDRRVRRNAPPLSLLLGVFDRTSTNDDLITTGSGDIKGRNCIPCASRGAFLSSFLSCSSEVASDRRSLRNGNTKIFFSSPLFLSLPLITIAFYDLSVSAWWVSDIFHY